MSEDGPITVRLRPPALAVETAFLTTGLPEDAREEALERIAAATTARGVTPAFVGIVDGRPTVGLDRDELKLLAEHGGKASTRDLPAIIAHGGCAGATVSSTLFLAHRAGLRVAATGGIGGVHEDASDVSADLYELARTPVILTCAGAKAILDLRATLEMLESLGVSVAGYGTSELPAFWCRTSGLRLSARVDSPDEAVDLWRSARGLDVPGALLVCVPPPSADALSRDDADTAVRASIEELEREEVAGGDVTPFLLSRIAYHTEGRSVRTNISLLENNAAVGAAIAAAL